MNVTIGIEDIESVKVTKPRDEEPGMRVVIIRTKDNSEVYIWTTADGVEKLSAGLAA